jgi:hypothetical protein
MMPEWQPIETAPTNRDVQLYVVDRHGPYPITFPCRLTALGWINATKGVPLAVRLVGWREWAPPGSFSSSES